MNAPLTYILLYFIGSNGTWHGYVDIFLNQNVAVSVIDSSRLYGNQKLDEDDKVDDDDDDDDKSREIPGPSSPKQLRIHKTNKIHVPMCVEVENKTSSLLHFDFLDKIIAETITNAFTQVNNSKALSGWLIPSFGCTLDHITVFLYDPTNDVLLQLTAQLPIWEIKGKALLDTTVIHIWMLLNFTVFMHKNIANEYEFNSSNFHNHAGTLLKEYRGLKAGEAFSGISCNDIYTFDVLAAVLQNGEKIRKRAC
jgi:hypothetical protein